jgi:hypothetical protein
LEALWKQGKLMSDKKINDVFRAVDDRQKTARFGLEENMKSPRRARSGLYNAVVFGRMVTFALQNLRSVVEGFDAWYEPKKEEMKKDPLMNYFHELRTDIEKRTEAHTAVSTTIKSFSTSDIARFQPAPPGATAFFIGDQNGGSGWQVKLADGTIEKYYIDLPPDIGEVTMHLPKAPEPYQDVSATKLVEKYLSYLDGLIVEAKKRFGTD